MSKKWKIAVADKVISLYTLIMGKPKSQAEFQKTTHFDSIVIYSTTALGDLMFNTPAIMAIRKKYPAAKLTLISSFKNRSLVENCDLFSEIIYWDQKVVRIFSLIAKIRKLRPNLAVILHSKQPYDIVSAVLSGCEFIIRDHYDQNAAIMNKWLVDYSRQEFKGHLIERKLKLVSVLGCDISDHSMFVPAAFTPLARDPEKKLIGFQLGASEKLRCWPVYRFVELAQLLMELSKSYHVVLIGGNNDVPLAQRFLAGLSPEQSQRVSNYIGTTNLPQLLAHIDILDILVTGDTGPLHLAVALKTKTVSLFATANPKSTGPLQDPELHKIIQVFPDKQTLDAEQREQPLAIISAQEVLDKITA